MVSRAIRATAVGLAYIVAGIPALIGIAFVARYAFVTSDTPTDGAATAFLFGMVAAGAFAGPAIAVAVKNRGRQTAAVIWWVLAVLAIVANWTHTLSAIAHRGAGLDAHSTKITTDTATDRKTLIRLERELAALPAFTPTTAEAVAAAHSAAKLAQRNRIVECGPNNETRGSRCHDRENDERAKQDALTRALENKATTDRASALEASATAVRKRLDDAPPAPPQNALGRTLGRFLPISAAAAATLQQAFVSAIVELLIAAMLALPGLLRSSRVGELNGRKSAILAPDAPIGFSGSLPTHMEATEPEILPPLLPAVAEEEAPRRAKTRRGVQPKAIAAPGELLADGKVTVRGKVAVAAPIASGEIDPKPVVAFLAEHMPADRGSRADWGDLYGGFLAWQTERGGNTLAASQFGAVLRHICEQAGIRVRRHGDRVYCLGRRFTWTG
jgi:hypothetical protein